MAKKTIQPAIEFDAEIRGDTIHCELSCASCTGTRLEVPVGADVTGKDIYCAACGHSVALGPAIAEVLDGEEVV